MPRAESPSVTIDAGWGMINQCAHRELNIQVSNGLGKLLVPDQTVNGLRELPFRHLSLLTVERHGGLEQGSLAV